MNKELISKKSYYKKSKEAKKQYNQQYREQNKDRLNKQKREEKMCECGVIIKKSGLAKHMRTKNHQKAI